jgi:NRPS condensation-like uncharacterized protein
LEEQTWKPPKWIKLDHSAIIYPATMSRKLSAMYRLSVTLNEDVDPDLLQEALCEVMPRFPTFAYCLRKGIFWDYLEQVDDNPTIQEDAANPMISILSEKKRRFLFRIRYFQKRISLEAFHALADGAGAMTFMMTLVSVYLLKKHGVVIPSSQYILSTDEKPSAVETEDSFPRFRGEKGTITREKRAYHYRGTPIASHLLGIITGIIPVASLKKAAEKHHCSVTVFLAAVMTMALQQQQTVEGRKKKPISISVPINLRSRFPSKTLRNFSYWMNIGIPAQYGEYSLEEITALLQAQSTIHLNPKELCARFTGTMSAADCLFFRIMPLFLKHWLLNLGDRILGDASCSHSLSNLGQITVPEEMQPYVRDIRSFIGRSRGKPGSGTCLSFGGNLYLTFTRKIHETAFERLFFTYLVEMGIPVTIESNALR